MCQRVRARVRSSRSGRAARNDRSIGGRVKSYLVVRRRCRWGWWWRDRCQLGRDVGPDQQYAAGCVVDDEARRGAEAERSEPVAVAVAGEDEDVHAVGGGHDLALDASAARLECGWAPELRLCCGE